jgi:hypothetical protein
VAAPITAKLRVDGDRRRSPAHLIREELAFLPNAERTKASAGGSGDADNPFARVPRTHFARLFVLDDVVYNGRLPSDVLRDMVKGPWKPRAPLTAAQPVDRLPAKYLVFAAAFDAASGDRSERDSYLTALWDVMSEPLTRIFRNCDGFDRVASAAEFCRYIEKCQVETTLPFNDYWIDPPQLKGVSLESFIPAIGVAAAAILIAPIFWLLGIHQPTWLTIPPILGLALAVWLAYHTIMRAGATPFPTAPNSDLPSVLKALHLQRVFTDFAIEAQGIDDDALREKFGKFLMDYRPDDVHSATQLAGIIPGAKP